VVTSIEELVESLDLDVEVRRVDVDPSSPPRGFLGSPTVLIGGRDMEPAARTREGTEFG
jgi:hypothetical protein